jgi:predicted tellurium resistance membrane protein TerC
MAIAVVLAVIIMLISSRAIVRFIHDFPTIKVLALAFVLLIGTALVADGMGFDIPKGYLYFAMLFSVMVEGINVTIARRKRRAAERRKSGG